MTDEDQSLTLDAERDPREIDLGRACAAFNDRPSAFDPAIANALTAIAELQRLTAALAPLAPLLPRLEAAVTTLEIIAGTKRCGCQAPRPVALAVGFMCAECGGNCSTGAETPENGPAGSQVASGGPETARNGVGAVGCHSAAPRGHAE